MCGIVGYTGSRPAAPVLLDGLSRLEYRGYDSAGIAVIGPSGEPSVRKARGKLSVLLEALDGRLPEGSSGIGHTRWATHGPPADINAHPHTDCANEIALVHNGIVENFVELRRELRADGHRFSSQTDTECISHLIERYLALEYDLEDAVAEAAGSIRGAHAVVVASKREPGKLVAFRLGNAGGVVVGYGEGETFLASDLPALLPYTRDVAYLGDGESVTITADGPTYARLGGAPLQVRPSRVPYDEVAAAKGPFEHFLLKEINDQPETVIDAMRGRVSFDSGAVTMDEVALTPADVGKIDRVVLIGMGTSLHAAMVGRTWIESLARIPAEVENSSEFRYRDPIIDERTLVVSVCQSGETADTLAAMQEAAEKGARQVTLCNYDGTQTTRIAESTILIRAGLEISVASTKTFVASLVSLLMLSVHLGVERGTISDKRVSEIVDELARLPQMIGGLVADKGRYEALAERYSGYEDFLFLGRGVHYPLAMEGALKLKELSYIHAEGYQAGEMKHGPISLIDGNMPVVALTPKYELYEKMLANVSEVRARGGTVIAIATEGDTDVADVADDVLYIPEASSLVAPMLAAIPMQLLAYEIAVRRGCDVDQPRNLAKSVTVE